jgi:HK97 family phage prohead protease
VEDRVLDRKVLDFGFEVKAANDAEPGTFEGMASTFGNKDRVGDIVERGAFSNVDPKSVAMLWQHDTHMPIGVWTDLKEMATGLKARGRLVLETQMGKDAYALLKAEAINGLSIGFRLDEGSAEWDDKRKVRRIKKVDLWEVSLVTFPANERARVSAVKSTPFHDLPLAERNRLWDRAAAQKRVQAWAATKGEGYRSHYHKAFLWGDADAGNIEESCRYLIADVVDGELHAVPRAIVAAASALMRTKSDDGVPEEFRDAVRASVDRYYEDGAVRSPWAKAADGDWAGAVKGVLTGWTLACETKRDWEELLRDVGLSHTAAKAIIASRGTEALGLRDAGDTGLRELIERIERTTNLLRSS